MATRSHWTWLAAGAASSLIACGKIDYSVDDGGAPRQRTDADVRVPPIEPEPPDPDAVVIPNLDSAVIRIEPVEGARDYRAYVMHEGVEVTVDGEGREHVTGATIFCAGLRQFRGPAAPETEAVERIEVTDLHGPTTYVVEALDRPCTFPGFFGRLDDQILITNHGLSEWTELGSPVPISSEETIRDRYGSLIINGQGPGSPPGQPADPDPPIVLRRWTVEVSPLDAEQAARRRTATFFADFSEDDQPVLLRGDHSDGTGNHPNPHGYSIAVYQNSQFNFYSTNTEVIHGNHAFIDRGQLHMLLPDQDQDVMGTVMAVPRTIAHLPEEDDRYLHVTFETASVSTARRYWWLSLCGPDTPGDTFREDGHLSQWISLGSGFFAADGQNPSVVGWNCLIVFPHDGIATSVPPGSSAPNPQNSIIVLIHRSDRPAGQTAVNVAPQQINDGFPRAWYRRHSGSTVTDTPMVDDVIDMAPRARFDIYASRSRLVMYVNGEQRICNDFGPERLTMAEAAVGFNDALYHSMAEHGELHLDFADGTGLRQIVNNTIFADQKTWDNVGFEEDVPLPSSYRADDCYTHVP